MADIRKVVTCFLRFKGKLLLLQRSSTVGTYQGKWAGVSGYIEDDEDSYRRALTEIWEETRLKQNQVTLVRKGEPLELKDQDKGIIWIVHPFLFDISTDQIQLDWEHINFKWIEPHEITNLPTVPNLQETYERVIKK